MKNSSVIFKFNNFPFNIGSYERKYKQIPERLPFIIRYDKRLGIINQKVTKEQRKALRLYYSLGGYASTPLGEGSFGDRRADWTLDFIRKSLDLNKDTFDRLSFLEIGCASGYLLNLIKGEGAQVAWGLEPGEKGLRAGKQHKLKIINDFFPSKKIDRKFDYILSHCVLEHLENPKRALLEMIKILNPAGYIFVVVPECEEKMLIGDISILAHQHVNYFTKNSLYNLFESVGLSRVHVFSSRKIATLYAWGRKTEKGVIKIKLRNKDDTRLLKKFINVFGKNIRTIQSIVNRCERGGKKIGLYGDCAALRGLLKFKAEPRIFDGDSAKTGKFMISSKNCFESKDQLVDKPVDVLFITPIDYDEAIRSDLKKIGFNDKITKVISVKAIYEKESGRQYTIGSSTP